MEPQKFTILLAPFLFYLIRGYSFGMFLLNKTRPEDAHIMQRKVAIATAHWRKKESQSTFLYHKKFLN